ncbi:hypothetical protein C0Q70_19163 [Pomacea canaliculata]|uniref:Xaa-Pro dipeptidase n=1 Tax=Pomacea canaliculata TaxID=400727 RepID=A0A2T7NIK1_POMCA|nr:hypothetical protein C0Q70_19163 [Pomacea canaliculata]
MKISMDVFKENRNRLCDRLSNNPEVPRGAIVLLQGGESETRYCSDHEPLFRQESYFHWLFGVEEPDFYGAIEVDSRKTILFPPKLPDSYAVWMGRLLSAEDFRHRYDVDEVYFADSIKDILTGRTPSVLLTLYGKNTDSGKYSKEAVFPGIGSFNLNNTILHPEISECRVFKSDKELEILRYVNKISSDAHKANLTYFACSAFSIFKNYCQFMGGMRAMSYTCICARHEEGSMIVITPFIKVVMVLKTGNNSMELQEFVTSNGKFTPEQRQVYQAVYDASRAVLAACRAGVSWMDMHKLAEKVELEALKTMGLVQGNVDAMMEARLGAVFMPHGLGHFMGIDTHDVGGYPEVTERPTEAGLRSLRTVRILQPRMVITVEPGLYFIDTLLDAALQNPVQSQFLVREVIDRFRGVGGVRIEDDIVVNEEGIELLTCVPRTVEEIEKVMADAKKSHGSLPQFTSKQ